LRTSNMLSNVVRAQFDDSYIYIILVEVDVEYETQTDRQTD